MELFSPEWLAALFAIIIVDLLLAGDNAVVIALAARNLDPVWKKRAIIWGTFGAVFVRVILVFFVSKLLQLPWVAFGGGLLLYGIAFKLVIDDNSTQKEHKAANTFWSAMGTIIVADTVMGLDNVLAIAGAARGDLTLIIIGLALSVPIMMGGSVLILRCLERMPWLVIAGAALLSGIAGRIILEDKAFQAYYAPSPAEGWTVVILVTLAVTAAAVAYKKFRHRPPPPAS